MFKRAILRTPSKSMISGLSTANLGIPNYELALAQHKDYIKALGECDLEVIVLPPLEAFPDSTFVEDVALLTDNCAIITNPGAESRKGEIANIRTELKKHYNTIEQIKDTGTIEAGDIMMVGSHFYIGLSERTNENGANQMISILNKYGKTGSIVSLEKVLHLKTGLAYLENNNLVACGEFLSKKEFRKFNILEVDQSESYAANCIWVNDKVIMPLGYPNARNTIEQAGYNIIEVDVSEFKKLDGGLSCLSLRF